MSSEDVNTARAFGSDGGGRIASKRRACSDDGGYVLIMFGLMMIPLIGLTAFAVDFGSWYATASRMQRAADSAALAGVVWYQDLPKATNVATTTATKNGFSTGGNISVQVTQVADEPRLRVDVRDTQVPTIFGRIFSKSINMRRYAVAEYTPPIPMGSPFNYLGNAPDSGVPNADQPQYWLQIFGPGENPIDGDRYTANDCTSPFSTPSVTNYLCASGAQEDYDTQGYRFTVHVPDPVPTGQLNIEVFDPAQIDVNQPDCSTALSQAQANQLDPLFPGQPTYSDRYRSVSAGGSQLYCTSDSNGAGGRSITTFMVRAPDATPLEDLDNPIISSGTCRPKQYGSVAQNAATKTTDFLAAPPASGYPVTVTDTAGVTTDQYPGFVADASGAVITGTLTTAQANTETSYRSYLLRNTWRRWVSVCTITTPVSGDYILQVKTATGYTRAGNAARTINNAVIPSDRNGRDSSLMKNKYSVRAWFGNGAFSSTAGSPSFWANGRLPAWIGASGAQTKFYLARIGPENKGRTLRVEFWDTGDLQGTGGATIRVRPPEEYRAGPPYGPAGGGTFTGCRFENMLGSATLTVNAAQCSLSNVSMNQGYQGSLNAGFAPIPSNYNCNSASALGCWTDLLFDWGGLQPNDHTVWSARVVGDPVRLVE